MINFFSEYEREKYPEVVEKFEAVLFKYEVANKNQVDEILRQAIEIEHLSTSLEYFKKLHEGTVEKITRALESRCSNN